jgi:hypothetical protein
MRAWPVDIGVIVEVVADIWTRDAPHACARKVAEEKGHPGRRHPAKDLIDLMRTK